jgi:UPF0716 family protein affecting phage T7 exclusion
MKRIATGLTTVALGMFLFVPGVKAQSWQDMQTDREAIQNGREQLHHDRQELRNDLRNGDYGAAAHEQAEMNRRRAAIAERQEGLNSDIANQNYGDDDNGYGYVRRHGRHHRPHDEDDSE